MRRDVTVSDDSIPGDCGPPIHQRTAHVAETLVLGSLVWSAIRTLHLDTDGEVVAANAISEAGFARMPGSVGEGDELDERAVASNQEMGGYPQVGDGTETVMNVCIEPIAEEMLDVRPTELAGRQADSVHYDQIDTAFGWPGVEVR